MSVLCLEISKSNIKFEEINLFQIKSFSILLISVHFGRAYFLAVGYAVYVVWCLIIQYHQLYNKVWYLEVSIHTK